MEKPQLILELEKELNCSFKSVKLSEITEYKPNKTVDTTGNVTGMNNKVIQDAVKSTISLTENTNPAIENISEIQNLELLIDKKAFLEKELITTYDSEKKFALQQQIKELENRILEMKK